MADKNTPRGRWPKALVEQTFPDSEGIVRQVVVRTADGVYRRDVRKLCMLEEKLLSRIEGQMKPVSAVVEQWYAARFLLGTVQWYSLQDRH